MGLHVRLSKKVSGFDLNIDWEAGNELTVLFGYSGAGKSMTLQMMAGLVTPDSGRLELDQTVYYDSAAGMDTKPQGRPFGYLFQDLALFPHMTVAGNIAYGAQAFSKEERSDRVKELISAFRLTGLDQRYPHEISGGQRQRAAFARALIRRPKLLLLDEPFSALDRPLRLEMRRFLRQMKDDFNIPAVMVTHDYEEAAEIADRVIIYEHGKVAQTGGPEEVRDHPINGYVCSLVSASAAESWRLAS